MRSSLAVFVLIVVMLSAQCSRHTADLQHPLLGRYALAGYDDSGRLIFTGEISLVSLERNFVKGQCTIKRERDAPGALHDHSGDCGGLFDGKKLDLDLAPGMDDAGVLFEGEFGDGRIKGVCQFDSFVGARPFGRFEAVRRTLG